MKPTELRTYSALDRCKPLPSLDAKPNVEVFVLQQDATHRVPGYRCAMTTGRRRFICGAFSYEKAVSGPVGQLPVSITGDECHFMVSNREWRDQFHQPHHVKVPGLTAVTLNEVGWQGTASGDEACQGEDVHIDGRIVHRVVEYSTSIITITVESFLISHEVISAEYSTERLQCPASVGKCAGASHAYTWDHLVVPPCPWKLARSASGILSKSSFFSNHEALLFQLGKPSTDPRCPGLEFQPTGFPELALTTAKPHLPTLAGGEVHFSLLFRVYAEFLQDQLHRLAVHGQAAYDDAHCHREAAGLRPGQLVPLGPGRFGRRLGDTFVEFRCPEVSVELREAESCYLTEIPVEHKQTPFVDVVSRVLQAGGTPSPCLNDFPLRVQGHSGWWRLLPRIELDVAPRQRIEEAEKPYHQFDRDSGLYSEDELLQWQHLQSVPTMQRLLTADLTQGVCHERDGCTLMPVPGAPSYALSKLEHTVISSITPTWVQDLKDAFYYGGLTGGWLVILIAVWAVWQCTQLRPPPAVAPGPATNVFTTVPAPSPRYLETSFQAVTEVPFPAVSLAIEDHQVDGHPPRLPVGGDVAGKPLVFRR